jgi:excisionase family DNA binding protein
MSTNTGTLNAPKNEDMISIQSSRPMTRAEAAEYLQIHPDTLYRWSVEEGKIAYCRLGEGARASLRFLKKDLDQFLSKQRIPTVEDTMMRRS